jgi:hypothetical protein
MCAADHRKKASLKAVFALMFYLVIPTMAIYLILETYPELGRERFESMVYWFVPLSILLVIVSQLSIRYPKGDTRRFTCNIAYVVITLCWLLAFLGGGLVITETWQEYEFRLHLWKYVALIVGVALFNALYYVLEWRVYGEGDDIGEDEVLGLTMLPLLTKE